VQAERQRLQQEHREAERLIEQQRALINDLELLRDGESATTDSTGGIGDASDGAESASIRLAAATEPMPPLPVELVDHYRELLRAYVIMGAGNLADDMAGLADLMAESHMSAQRTLQLHVEVLEELVAGLGNRSARHVMNRADLLALEVLGHLADGYRRRYYDRRHPPRQLLLPGFDADDAALVLSYAA
jgi:hypothetical protein